MALDREAEVDSSWDSVLSLTDNSHGDKGSGDSSDQPVMDMIADRAGSRGRTGKFSGGDDSSSSLGNGWNKLLLGPLGVGDSSVDGGSLSLLREILDHSVRDIRVLSERMVSPDDEILNASDINLQLFGNLIGGSILVQSSESGEVSGWDIWSIVRADHGISVSRVSNNYNLDISVGPLIDGLSLRLKDESILSKQILSFHSWSSWLGSD